jgi:hypothetical protein
MKHKKHSANEKVSGSINYIFINENRVDVAPHFRRKLPQKKCRIISS